MSSYKLYYFPARGRAELSRFVFAQAGVEYEDVRLAGEEWGKLKPGEQAELLWSGSTEWVTSCTALLAFCRFALGHDALP